MDAPIIQKISLSTPADVPETKTPALADKVDDSLRVDVEGTALLKEAIAMEMAGTPPVVMMSDFRAYAKSVSIAPQDCYKQARDSLILQTGRSTEGSGRVPSSKQETVARAPLRTRVSRKLLDFVTDLKTERALRFILPIPLCLYLSYHPDVLGYTLSQLVIILYLIQAALLPPLLISIPLLFFMAVPAVCFALGIVTAVWAFDTKVAEGKWSDNKASTITLITLFFCFLIVCNCKIGSLAQLLTIGFLITTYATEFVLISSSHMIRHGVNVTVPSLATLESSLMSLISKLPSTITALLIPILQTVAKLIASGVLTAGTQTLVLTEAQVEELSVINPVIRELVNVPINVTLHQDEAGEVSVPGGWHIVKVLWKGKRQVGLLHSGVCCGLIAVGFYCLSLLLPPIRSMTAQLRNGSAAVASRIANDLTYYTQSLGFKKSEDRVATPAVSPRFRDAPKTMVAKDHDFRVYHYATSDALSSIKSGLAGSALERVFLSPLGVNSLKAWPGLLEQLETQNIAVFLFGTFWVLMHRIVADEGETGFQVLQSIRWTNQDGTEWTMDEWVTDIVPQAVGIIHTVSAALSTTEVPREEGTKAVMVQFCHDRLTQLKLEIETKWTVSHHEMNNAVNNVLGNLQQDTEHWRLQFLFWKCLMSLALYHIPVETAAKCQAYLEAQRQRSLKAVGFNIGSFILPLGILFYGLVSPAIDLIRYLVHLCYKPRQSRPPATGIWAQVARSTEETESKAPERLSELVYDQLSCQIQGYGRSQQMPSLIHHDKIHVGARREWHGFLRHYRFWYIFRLVCGLIALFATQLFWTDFRSFSFLHRTRKYAHLDSTQVDWDEEISTRMGPWVCLGFMTTLTQTVEGTTKRGMLRYLGVIFGVFSAWLCMKAAPHNPWVHGVWMMVTDFVVVWLAANKKSPLLGFDSAWGYGAQLFTWQQAIIIVPAYLEQADFEELVLSRLVAQFIGITCGILVSHIINPTSSSRGARLHLSDAIYCHKKSLAGLVELSFMTYNDQELKEKWIRHVEIKIKDAITHLQRASELLSDNNYMSKLPLFRNPPSLSPILNGVRRIVSYRRLHMNFLTKLILADKGSRRLETIEEDPELMVNLEFSKQTIGEVCLQMEYLSLLLQTIMDGNKVYYAECRPNFCARKMPSKEVLANMIEAAAFAAQNKLKQLAAYLYNIQDIQKGAPFEMVDRRVALFSFFLIELEEYRWLAAQLLTL